MEAKKNTLLALIILVIAFGLAACETPAGRTAGEVIDDSTITTKVKAKLFDDEQLSGFAIAVETFEREVTLNGAVDSLAQKQRATRIAQSVKGVRAVNNLLKIK